MEGCPLSSETLGFHQPTGDSPLKKMELISTQTPETSSAEVEVDIMVRMVDMHVWYDVSGI